MPSSTIQSVRMARLSTEVYATSKTKPSCFSSCAARAASSRPRSERSTSVHPVNRFSLFQVLSPWRSRTSVGISIQLLERLPSRVSAARAELLFDAEELVVLRHPIAAACRSGLDLAGRGRDREVGDGRILGLARAVRNDAGVAGFRRHRDRIEGLGDRPDLIE